eukprot:3341279-Pleurochrysis_carterae.AAC.5
MVGQSERGAVHSFGTKEHANKAQGVGAYIDCAALPRYSDFLNENFTVTQIQSADLVEAYQTGRFAVPRSAGKCGSEYDGSGRSEGLL